MEALEASYADTEAFEEGVAEPLRGLYHEVDGSWKFRMNAVKGIKTIEWERDSRIHRIPALFHAAWQAPDGRAGIVLANWTDKRRKAVVTDKRLGRCLVLHRCGAALASQALELQCAGASIEITVPALGSVLLEAPAPRPRTKQPATPIDTRRKDTDNRREYGSRT